jgi:hypothetical protein
MALYGGLSPPARPGGNETRGEEEEGLGPRAKSRRKGSIPGLAPGGM